MHFEEMCQNRVSKVRKMTVARKFLETRSYHREMLISVAPLSFVYTYIDILQTQEERDDVF